MKRQLQAAALSLAATALSLAAAVLLSCGPLTETGNHVAEGPSTETGNPTLTGIVRDAAGAPAVGARVLLLRLPDVADVADAAVVSPDSASLRAPTRVDSLIAGADGSYRFDSLAAGVYAVEGADAGRGLLALLPRAEIPADTGPFLRRDTLVLKRPGTLTGVVRRDGNPKPAGVIAHEGILARVAGTERAVYTDTAGRYVLDNVPEGIFRVAFAAADGHYLPGRLDAVEVAAGVVRELPPVTLVWSPLVDPPSPSGLTVRPDSAAGLMRLAWRPVQVSNFSHYVVVREEVREAVGTAAHGADTLPSVRFQVLDTAFDDSLESLAAGSRLRYQVLAVNLLGAVSPGDAVRGVPATVPKGAGTDSGEIVVLVLRGAEPEAALVRLYAIPASPGPEDSLPRRVRLMDSLRAAADGRARFARLPAGRYTAVAGTGDGALLAARVGLRAHAAGPEDTLRLSAPGRLAGTVSRQQLWCSYSGKLDANIEISLAGLPLLIATDYDGAWSLSGVPAGSHRAVIQALPPGCFLPDTVEAVVVAGALTTLPKANVRPNPGFIPKVSGLRLVSAGRDRVTLAWDPVSPAYPDLLGYEVVRRGRDQAILATSAVVPDTGYSDDVSALPSGAAVDYLVRAVSKAGMRGPFGGDTEGLPVYFTIP